MTIEFSDHAKQQLKRRNISKQLVKKVVLSPQESISIFRQRELLRAKIGGKLLEIVTRREETKIVIITAYYLEE